MKHRDEVIALLSQLNPEVHPHLVLAALSEAGYDIVKVSKPEDETLAEKVVRKVKGK